MKSLRRIVIAHRRALLAFVLAAVGMQALVPAGLMVAPSPGHFAQIILCPQTHPLARAYAATAPAGAAAMHAAMGHGPTSDDSFDPAPSAAASSQTCAFAGLALAALPPDRGDLPVLLPAEQAAPHHALRRLHLAAAAYLRPPLRAPPALI